MFVNYNIKMLSMPCCYVMDVFVVDNIVSPRLPNPQN